MQVGAAAPSEADRARWLEADNEARPRRQDRLRAALEADGLHAYFGLKPENSRYLTGFVLGDGEDKVAGASGRFFVSADETVVVADSRYHLQALEEWPDSRVEDDRGGFAAAWPDLVSSLRPVGGGERVARVGVEASVISHGAWEALAEATPHVELVPTDGLVESARQTKEPHELERVAAACRIADEALAQTLPEIKVGISERELALSLEWKMRTGGADGLAFDVACLSGPRAARVL